MTGQKHDRDMLSMNKARKKKDKEEMKRTSKSEKDVSLVLYDRTKT